MKLIVHSWDKRDLAGIIRDHTPARLGAEIGVFNGENSEFFLRSLPDLKMYLIDPYHHYTEGEYTDFPNSEQDVQDARYAYICALFDEYKKISRCEIFRLTSLEAAPKIADNSLDFAYIDANHAYEYVKQDIDLWWPKVKEGGILAGHDYMLPAVAAAIIHSGLFPIIHWLKTDDIWLCGKGILQGQ